MQPDKTQLQKELADLKERMDELSARIDAEPEGVWKPKCGERYFVLTPEASVAEKQNWDKPTTEDSFSIGNVFCTEQEAANRLFKLKIEQRLRELAGGFRPKPRENREYITTDLYGRAATDARSSIHQASIPFRPGEAQKAIDAIGQADLKRYFEVAP